MRELMVSLQRRLARHRRAVVTIWLLAAGAAVPLALDQSNHLTGGGFEVPESQSKAVQQTVETRFPEVGSAALAVTVRPSPGLSPQRRVAALERLDAALEAHPVLSVAAVERAQAREALREGRTAVLPVVANGTQGAVLDATVELRDELAPGEPRAGSTIYLSGQAAVFAGLQELAEEDLRAAELAGFPIVAAILVVVFGSLAAACLPLLLGATSVAVTGALIWLLAQQWEMSIYVANLASMIGIGVAVDYSLFVLSRYRQEVARGRDPSDARDEAMATSGLAVLFSGAAVVTALGGLWLVDNQALQSMAAGAMLVVVVAALTAITVLPVLIRLLEGRIERPSMVLGRVARARRRRRRAPREGFWIRWTTRVMMRPRRYAALTSAALIALAIPALFIETGTTGAQQLPDDHDVLTGRALSQAAQPGAADSLVLVGRDRTGGRGAVRAIVRRSLGDDPAIARVGTVRYEGATFAITITPAVPAGSEASDALVGRVRDWIRGQPEAGPVRFEAVGGEPARLVDVSRQLGGSMWKVIGFALASSFIVLLVLLRSLVLAVKAVVMNLLSIGVAFGVLVAVFQWGWFDGLFGFQSLGALDMLTPPLVFAVVFGLSMDYEVFMLSRIRERYEIHGDTARAVAEGLSSSARTITSAALIMSSVFLVFVFTSVSTVKEVGLGNAVAIAVDATVVRLLLVPATMRLLGRANWYLPRWLDRVLPKMGRHGDQAAELARFRPAEP